MRLSTGWPPWMNGKPKSWSWTIRRKAAFSAAAKPRLWTPSELRETGTMNLDLSPDGRRFAVFPIEGEEGEERGPVRINFVLSFADELRRRVAAGK